MPHNSKRVRRRPLLVATGNPGKLQELAQLLAGLPFDLLGYGDVGITVPQETGATYLENALLKARHAARTAGAAAIADDSGLEVDALDGAPGVWSARYAGADADDAANNAKLIAALSGIPLSKRSARYRCAVVYVEHESASAPLTAAGVWEGCIIEAPRGAGGFGYDPYFLLPELNMTAAELDPQEKNRRSHRGTALRALRAQLIALLEPAVSAPPASAGRLAP